MYPAGGYAHLTGKKEPADRITARAEKQTVVLSLGDYDPHGLTMFENIRDDVTAFVEADRRPMTRLPIFERVALTEEQVEMFDLAHEPYEAHGFTLGAAARAEACAVAISPEGVRLVSGPDASWTG